MGVTGGPDIVRDGIIFALDAGSSRCFESGNSTATDLIQEINCSGANGNPGTGMHTPNTSNFPTFNPVNQGVFDFAGGKGINIDGNLGTASQSSICMWIFKNSSATQYFTDGRNNGGDWFLSNYSNNNINWENGLRYNYDGSYDASNAQFLNQWIFMVVTSDSSISRLYLNGVEASPAGNSSVDEDFGINYRIGTRYTTSSQWTGYMGPIYFYNRAITGVEVQQNFQAHRTRFGL